MVTALIPKAFVWTKYGIEAGEPVAQIFARKERERQSSDGIFLWGIGNSVGGAVRTLILRERIAELPVVFSPMKSFARSIDSAPENIWRWSRAVGLDGAEWAIPNACCVTSRGAPNKRRHYALVCRSAGTLSPNAGGFRLNVSRLTNYLSGNPVGSSQVTSVVRSSQNSEEGDYPLALFASLVFPYVIELRDPVEGHATPMQVRPPSQSLLFSENPAC